jgi:hypothetical protein
VVTVSLADRYHLTPQDVADARAWCADVVADSDTVDEATDDEVLTYVARRYEGGIAAFIADGVPA